MIRVFLVVFGALLILDTIFAANFSNINLGIVMPFVIGLPLLILGIFFTPITEFMNHGWFGQLIKWGMIGCYGLFTLLFLITTIIIKTAASRPMPSNPDAIIVLGAGIRGTNPSITLAKRLDKAKELLEGCDEHTLIIVSGGKGHDEVVSESTVMKNYLISKGVLADRIIEESSSTSTEENFLFSKAIIDEMRGKDSSIVFVTTGFHVYRAGKLAQRLGIDASGVAAKDFAPLAINNYLRECAAIVQHFILGKL